MTIIQMTYICWNCVESSGRRKYFHGAASALIGSIRRECVDHVVALGEGHLRRILTKYAAYYNRLRTHRSLNKDAPIHRAIQRVGPIGSAPVLGGLHHHYCRI
jgi:transposase InsO family protein